MTKGFIVHSYDDSINFYRVSKSGIDRFFRYECEAQIEVRLNGGEIFYCDKGYLLDDFFNEYLPKSEEEVFPKFPAHKQLPYFSML